MFIKQFKNKEKTVSKLISQGLSSAWLKLEKKALEEIVSDFLGSEECCKQEIFSKKEAKNETNKIELQLINFLKIRVVEISASINLLNSKYSEYATRYMKATSDEDQRKHILEFSKLMGSSARQLRRDKKAFSRWFGHDAISDRFRRNISGQEKNLSFILERLGTLINNLLSDTSLGNKKQNDEDKEELEAFKLEIWKKFELEETIVPLFVYSGDDRLRINAFKCLILAITDMPKGCLGQLVNDKTLQYIYRAALDHRQETWIQTEALELLSRLSPEDFILVLKQRFENIGDQSDIFVRYHGITLLASFLADHEEYYETLKVLQIDSSPYVRQAFAKIIPSLKREEAFKIINKMLFEDDDPSVRASIALCLKPLMSEQVDDEILNLIVKLLRTEQNEFVLHVILDAIPDFLKILSKSENLHLISDWVAALMPELTQLYQNNEYVKVRRWVAIAKEWAWCYIADDRRALLSHLKKSVELLDKKDSTRVKLSDNCFLEDEVARILSILAHEDFGCDVKVKRNTLKLYKKPSFVFRLWRFLYELKNPSTDKRQAHSHTIGRLSRGNILIPSAILSELSETKVPGEPLYFIDEDGWRAYLPLVDDVISLLDPLLNAKPMKIYSADGVTTLTPPANILQRMAGVFVLTLRFRYFSSLRNWHEGSNLKPSSYIEALKSIGVKCEFRTHRYSQAQWNVQDSKISRFFASVVPVGMTDWLERFQDYFYSVYENTIEELLFFITLGSGFFVTRHLVLNAKIRKARKSIALVIGGWGTRGKSGTERLKAALFNALGFSVISKTTGCEAMFLHAFSYGSLREMFLFRPYDKATIWEQSHVLQLAEHLNSDVFLWECMGLTPSYVEILQRQWMCDDIATITNTYPDHEDLQGPAGYNIPEVMTRFIPENALVLNSEEQMRPILEREAKKRNSAFISVGWKQAGLLTKDVLQRFPYDEHPYNIALVLKMAETLDIESNYALKEMADRVVPDLGVLKTYPTAKVNFRLLTFVMGMSANERYGAMGNWSRTGFDQHDLSRDPEIWVTGVINNRADRIPRSRVFSELIVSDISFDRLILIGSNLTGLMGYIKDAWSREKEKITLWKNDNDDPLENLSAIAKRYKIPANKEQLKQRIKAMVVGLKSHFFEQEFSSGIKENVDDTMEDLLNDDNLLTDCDVITQYFSGQGCSDISFVDDLFKSMRREKKHSDEYWQLHQKIEQTIISVRGSEKITIPIKERLNEELKNLVSKWFKEKLIVIDNEHANGNQIIQQLAEQTPPGLHNKIMGLQNIKGTGLDFVYKWLAWDFCYQGITKISNNKEAVAKQGLSELSTFQDYNLLCVYDMKQMLASIRHKLWTQREKIQAEINLLESHFNKAINEFEGTVRKEPETSNFWFIIIDFFERLLDSGDAVKRRKKADTLYKDLLNQRISHEKAAIELKLLNKRQKGGWLKERLQTFKKR